MHVVATAGHVDHGKSALVRALTGTDPDRFVEEKQRGLTIDLGFAWTSLPTAGAVEFVDVPGHVRFVSNMLAGVAVIEAGVLCVDAREGWRAQTEEHLRILDVIGLPAGLVAVTKAGTVGEDRIAAVVDEVARRTAGSVLARAPVVVCDSVDGTGLDDLRERLDRVLAAIPPAVDERRPRLWVDRAFTIAGAGTVVTGGVGHGSFAVGDRVLALDARGGHPARVRGIQALGSRIETAPPGSRAALNLAGIGRRAVGRGDAVVRPDEWPVSRVVDAQLTVLPAVDHDVTARGAYLVYVGTAVQAVKLRVLGASRIAPGCVGSVRLSLGRALPLVAGDRFVLRESGRGELIGGGELVDVDPVIGRRPAAPPPMDVARRALLERLEGSRPVGLDIALLDEPDRGVLAGLEAEGVAATVAGYAVAAEWHDELSHHPLVEKLEGQLFSPPPPSPGEVAPAVLRALLRRGLVVVKGGVYFAAGAPDAAARVLASLPQARQGGFTVGEARQALGTTRKWAVPLLELLDDSRATVRNGDRRILRDT
jgi:selenocysteine-specific elongation factor